MPDMADDKALVERVAATIHRINGHWWNRRKRPEAPDIRALLDRIEALSAPASVPDAATGVRRGYDPSNPLPGHLYGLASLFRAFPDDPLWGRREEAEHAASIVERAAAALATPPASVPSGMVMVPVEPTEAMERAGVGAHLQSGSASGRVGRMWSAMLAAAPSSPVPSGWRTIDSAPTDRELLVGYWFGPMQNGKTTWVQTNSLPANGRSLAPFTHWADYPAAPSNTEQGEGGGR